MPGTNELLERLRKIEALMAGAGTPGERDAATAAMERVKARLAETRHETEALKAYIVAG